MQQLFALPEKRNKPVILGTDWHTDCDDAVAIRVLAWYHWKGAVQLLGVSIDSAMECSVASMKRFLSHERLEVPVGLDHSAYDYGGEVRYQRQLADGMDWAAENRNCEEAVHLYRRLLAGAAEPVELIEIGFLQVLEALLDSGPDDVSELNGRELVSRKVSKLWVMGGRWDRTDYAEFNFSRTERARKAAHRVLEDWPTAITLLGWETAATVFSGDILKTSCNWQDDLKDILHHHGAEDGRPSWDPLLVYLACVGDETRAGFRTVRGRAFVDETTGCSRFAEDPGGRHCYVVKMNTDAQYGETLNRLILDYALHLRQTKLTSDPMLEYTFRKGEKRNEENDEKSPAADIGFATVGVRPSVMRKRR